jgi:hypothetical protein
MLRFGKPKTPGYGISSNYYVSVLSSRATLPTMLEIINPNGDGGAITGFGAPLAAGASKESLSQPMERGAYAVTTKDRKTVLTLKIVSKEEAGFDPEAFANSDLVKTVSPELVARLRGTWTLGQLSFESHDASVIPSMRFLLGLCARFGALAEGVIADPLSQRYLLPEEVFHPMPEEKELDVRDLISINEASIDGGWTAFTLGLQKFALPEFEMSLLEPSAGDLAGRFFYGLCQGILRGKLPQPGDKVGAARMPFQVAMGGLDRSRWEGIPCFELLPPTGVTAEEALEAWVASVGG